MRLLNILRLRLRSLLSRKTVERELQEELCYHLERQIDEEIAAGKAPEEARYIALQSIRDMEQRKEECRDMRNTRWLEDIGGDLRYAARQFLKHKSFFAIAAVTLALGIGANTAIFSVVHGVLLRPFPYPHPERLVAVWCNQPSSGVPKMGCSLPDIHEIAARNHSLTGLANYYWADVNITNGTPERVLGVYASTNLFPLLGVNAAIGRTFAPSEAIYGKNRVVILSDALWKKRFGGALGTIGQRVYVNSEPYTVIGVMPRGFPFPDPSVQLWMPLSFAPNDSMATRDNRFLSSIGRLRAQVSVEQARSDVQAIGRQLKREFGEDAGVGTDISDYLSSVVGDTRPALLILLGAVGILLLIACINVANLLLSKASARQREISVRATLGASRGRLIRQLLTESVLLGLTAAFLGTGLSAWLVRLIRLFGPEDIPRIHSVEIDSSVLIFIVLIAVFSAVLFGLIPALDFARAKVSEALKEGGRSLTSGTRTMRWRNVLAIAEITLSLVLIVSAGLVLQSLRRLQKIDPGFKSDNLLTMSVTLPLTKYPDSDPAKLANFFDEVTKRLERIPGIRFAGASTSMPIADWGGWGKYFTVEERPASRLADVPVIRYVQVTPHFAKALGVPVMKGRFFTEEDTGTRPLVAMINESAQRRFFPNEDPIGKRVYPNPPDAITAKLISRPGYQLRRLTIVGIVGDVKQSGLSQPVQPELWVPDLQGTAQENETPAHKMFLFIKANRDPLPLADVARRIVRSLDPEQPVADIATMESRLRTSLATRRFQIFLFEGFALLALFLAAVGVYGVLSYLVRLRMREIGIRMTLGANRSDVLKTILRHGLLLGLVGVSSGVALALALTRFIASLLFGLRANDTFTFLCASLILMGVVIAASLLPSISAARADPISVLRSE